MVPLHLAGNGGHGGSRAARPEQLAEADQAHSKSGQRAGSSADTSGQYLTLVVPKTGKHLHKTLWLKKNRETNFLLFLLKFFPCIPLLGNMPMEDWG